MKASKKTGGADSKSENGLASAPLRHRSAPDGGWGWIVVIGAVVLNFLIGGAVNTFGVLYVALLEKFNQSAGKTAWVGSMANAMGLLLGPLSSALSTRFSCRTMVIVGGVLTSLGWLTTGFMPKLELMFITYGVIAGVGKSMAYTPSIVMVGQWFDKRRSLANGLSVAGAGVGTFAFAPLLEILLEQYGFTGTMLIMSGVMLNICLCGILFRPVPVNRKMIENTSRADMDSNTCNVSKNQTEVEKTKKSKNFKDYLDYSLLLHLPFVCFGVSVMLATLGHSPATVMLPSLAKQYHVTTEKAAFLLSIMGITDIIGRLIFGALCDVIFFRRNRKSLYVASILISGIANVTCGFATKYWHFATYSVIFGLFAGSYNALTPVIIVDLLGADKLSSAFGLALLFQGVGFLLGPPMAGWTKDGFAGYHSAFYFAGIAMILGSIVINLSALCKCKTQRKNERLQGESNQAYALGDIEISVIGDGKNG